MSTPHPPVEGTVFAWHDEDGWGVLRTPDGLDVWCHYSQVLVAGYRSLRPGDRVTFDYETPGQDGYPARVPTSAVPIGRLRQSDDGSAAVTAEGAYGSELHITWDDEIGRPG